MHATPDPIAPQPKRQCASLGWDITLALVLPSGGPQPGFQCPTLHPFYPYLPSPSPAQPGCTCLPNPRRETVSSLVWTYPSFPSLCLLFPNTCPALWLDLPHLPQFPTWDLGNLGNAPPQPRRAPWEERRLLPHRFPSACNMRQADMDSLDRAGAAQAGFSCQTWDPSFPDPQPQPQSLDPVPHHLVQTDPDSPVSVGYLLVLLELWTLPNTFGTPPSCSSGLLLLPPPFNHPHCIGCTLGSCYGPQIPPSQLDQDPNRCTFCACHGH